MKRYPKILAEPAVWPSGRRKCCPPHLHRRPSSGPHTALAAMRRARAQRGGLVEESPRPKTRRADLHAPALRILHEDMHSAPMRLRNLIIELDIVADEEWLLAISRDLMNKGADFTTVEMGNGYYTITAAIKLRDSFRYGARLKALSRGTAAFSVRLPCSVRG